MSEPRAPDPRREGWGPIQVSGTDVPPGSRQRVELPTARLATGSEMSVPVEIVHGKRPGPRLWLTGAVHGDELNGIEIIRRVLMEMKPGRLRGTVLAVPIVNVFGFITESRYLPDRRDLNRSFPGSARGSLAARLAHVLMTGVVEGCDYGIDLHTGTDARTNLPQVRGDLSDPETLRLARIFGAEITIHAALRDGSLRAAATSRGARVLVYEGGEAGRFGREEVDRGVEGVFRVLGALGMTGSPPSRRPHPPESVETTWTRAGRSGLFHLEVKPGELVRKGQRLGMIQDAFGERVLQVKARSGGLVIGLTRHPLVNRGDALVHVARILEGEPAEALAERKGSKGGKGSSGQGDAGGDEPGDR
jgi:uncharacterized protein